MSDSSSQSPPDVPAGKDQRPLIAFTWVWVGAPLAYGLYELIRKATQLFTG
ncbi:MFS transporter small subunit [Streptomyces parvus]|uniref:MFS transporter small subunit n=1 Tax=Streptomyces parvus TaxID=66428 RepID=UPI0033EF0693